MTDKSILDRLLSVINELTNGNKKKFAEMLGISPTSVNSWINEGYLPKTEHLANIQEKLGINLNWLLTGEGERYIIPSPLAGEGQGERIREQPAPYYSSKEKEYINKLIKILRTKQDKTVKAIMQNIDAFLDNPDKKNKTESDVSGVIDKDIQNANAK